MRMVWIHFISNCQDKKVSNYGKARQVCASIFRSIHLILQIIYIHLFNVDLYFNRVHIYIRTRSLSRKLPKRLFWIAYLALYGLFVIGVMILFIIIAITPKEDINYATISTWEGIYICVVSALLLAGALAFGISLLVFFRRMRILSAELQSRTRKVSSKSASQTKL